MYRFRLSNGVEVPKIGFGTYKTAGNGPGIIRTALENGYRHLDTAAFYDNEAEVAQAVAESGISRKELFLTTKIWKTDLGYESAIAACEASMKRLQTDYLDLLLIHWPRQELGNDNWKVLDKETWKAMEELYEAGRIRAIGVSNFMPHHLLNLMETAHIMPMVNQIEFHPGYPQWGVVDFCRKNQIQVEAWSPIGRGRMLQEPLLLELAEKYGRTPAQICIRFAVQCGVLPLPKSSSQPRMKENLDVFDFEMEKADMYRILTLPQMGWSGEHPDRERISAEIINE